ncbi:MAG: FAD:protein FMN transferase [Rikenellaceae bacterium]
MKNIVLILSCVLLFACGKDPQKRVIDGFALGTTYHIVYHSDSEIVQRSIDSLLNDFENSCSLYREKSLLSKINNNETDSLDNNITECLSVAGMVNRRSGGVYDVTIKPLVEAYGFYGEYGHGAVNKDSLRDIVGFDKVSVSNGKIVKADPRIQIDLNSLAKGYSVDLVSRWIAERGVSDFLVEIGGEVYCSGDNGGKGWKVGIDKPTDGNFTPGADMSMILTLKDKALATSGNYRRTYTDTHGKRVNHTFSPLTLESVVNSMASVTIVAPTVVEADAYATAVMAMGFEKGREMVESDKQLEALFIYYDRDSLRSYVTKNLGK